MQENKQLSLFFNDQTESIIQTSSQENQGEYFQCKPKILGITEIDYIQSSGILTPAKGFISKYKFTLNPYSGCSFGCDYCYARFFSTNQENVNNWGKWIKVKENAIILLRKALFSKNPDKKLVTNDTIYMSSVTDPYQPIEKHIKLTRMILEELIKVQPKLTIQTRSPLVIRDIDLFREFNHIRVNISITTDSDTIRKKYEPFCPSIKSRFIAAQKLVDSDIPIGISISPMLPIINPEKFGARIAKLNASEYVTQFAKPTRSRFTSGTSAEFLKKLEQDEWTHEKYQIARNTIAQELSNTHSLLEGGEGYSPA